MPISQRPHVSEVLGCLVCGKRSFGVICAVCANRLKKEALRNEIGEVRAGRIHALRH